MVRLISVDRICAARSNPAFAAGHQPVEISTADHRGVGAKRDRCHDVGATVAGTGDPAVIGGTGADSGTIVMSAPSGALTRLVKVHLAVASFPSSDVVQARVMLERFSAMGAAKNRSAAALEKIESILVRMDEPDTALDRFSELDTEFHVVGIAESGGNRLIAYLTVAIRESIRADIESTLVAEPDWPAVRTVLRSDHHLIFQALKDTDGPLAADLLEKHIIGFC